MIISDRLRKAVRTYTGTLYAVAKKSGVGYGALCRFMSGERDLLLGDADKLAEFLGLALKLKKEKTRR